jgi:metal-responsive CopG/Arc/MetJ family transcriptional regulator
MARPKSENPMTQIGIRLPDDLIDRLDGETERRNREVPGANFSRADVIRILLTERLEELKRRK